MTIHPLFTQGFSSFVRRRRARRHFERRPLLGALVAAHAPAPQARDAIAAQLGQALLASAHDDPAQALARLKSQADGLDSAEAARRLARDGPNEVQHEAPLPGWLRLWHCYLNPFNGLLTALALRSFLSADAKATVVIAAMVALSTGIRFVQEGRSQRAAEGLRAMVSNTATVIRRPAGKAIAAAPGTPPAPQEIALRALVAGDVVALSAGDMIPADCRLRGEAGPQAGGGQAPGCDPELRRDGHPVHRQDRHADAGQDRAGPPCRRLRPGHRRGAELRLPLSTPIQI